MILGIDPGTRVTGYGLLSLVNGTYQTADYGCIRPPASATIFDRYYHIFEGVSLLINQFQPKVVVVETQFVKRNPQSAIKLGMARGAVIIAGRHQKIPIFEYAPSKVKLAVVGQGNATKYQVQMMIKTLLNLTKPPPEDAADALALALCHSNQNSLTKTLSSHV